MAAAANKSAVAGDSSAASRHAPSPWTQVVRGPLETEPIAATSADLADDPTAEIDSTNGAKKPVWNKPSNGAAELGPGPVMWAESWPALSESTRASPKASSSSSSSSAESAKPIPDGSVVLPQGAGILPSSSHSQVTLNNAQPSLAPPNHIIPTRQNSMKRSGGSSSGNNNISNGVFSQPPQSPQSPAADMPPSILGKSVQAVAEMSPRDHTHKEGGQRVGSQSRNRNNDHMQRNDSFRKGNGGTHPRGDGSHHHNFGGRGNQDRGNNEWNSQRSFNGRDSHSQPQRASPRGFLPPPPTQFINPPPVAIRPYPVVYPDMSPQVFLYAAPPESFRGVPLVSPVSPHGMYYAGPDPQLIASIVHQVDYYFSNENLVKDIYLRNNMDDQGWVPVQLIASFKKMSILTENVQLILAAVCNSAVVEVQGDKIRRRGDWARWIMPTAQQSPVSSPHAQGSYNHEMLVANTHSLSLEEKPKFQGHSYASFSRSSSGDFSQSQAPGQVADRAVSARSPSE